MFFKSLKLCFDQQLALSKLFFEIAFYETLTATVVRAIAEFLQVFALFIPLKILILVGSNEIPSYFQDYISEATKINWLIGLTFTTLFVYLLSIMLNIYFGRLTTIAHSRFSQILKIHHDKPRQMRFNIHRIYKLTLQNYANALIVLLGIVMIIIIKPLVILFVTALIGLEFLIIKFFIGFNTSFMNKLKLSVKEDAVEYLEYFSSINFLAIFLFLIAEYLLSGHINSVVAILVLLFSRRVFLSCKQLGRNLIRLSEENDVVDFYTNILAKDKFSHI